MNRPVSVLIVCTANICRSPAAAVLLQAGVRPSPRGPGVQVASAGTHALVGAPVAPEVEAALAARGLSAADHRAQQLTSALVSSADLVLTATREHRAFVVSEQPLALRRTFTLLEFARLARAAAAADAPGAVAEYGLTGERLRELTGELGARRHAARVATDDDLDDPIGLGPLEYETMVSTVAAAVHTLAGKLPPVRT